MGTTNKIPWFFLDFDSKIETSLIYNKIPWLFPDYERDWNFHDCGKPELIIYAEIKLKPC